MLWYAFFTTAYLQGRVKFPTGGKVREPFGLNRCDSDTDSTVWMEEENNAISMPWVYTQGFF